jgi:DNA-directed RNA polymerase specialized sigma24 family protein
MSVKPVMKKESIISQEAFDQFMAWLNPEPDLAGRKYEDIRRRLILIFTCRGCLIPEELADETINRVIRRVQDIAPTYVGDPALYFYGVAHNVHLEYCRRRPDPPPPPIPAPPQSEEAYACLEQCLEQVPRKSQELILGYYQEEKKAKIQIRRDLAQQLGIPLNALRIRAHRIRMALQECVFKCLRLESAR